MSATANGVAHRHALGWSKVATNTTAATQPVTKDNPTSVKSPLLEKPFTARTVPPASKREKNTTQSKILFIVFPSARQPDSRLFENQNAETYGEHLQVSATFVKTNPNCPIWRN